jgi:hypothetical protein
MHAHAVPGGKVQPQWLGLSWFKPTERQFFDSRHVHGSLICLRELRKASQTNRGGLRT